MIERFGIPRATIILGVLGLAALLFLAEGASWIRFGAGGVLWGAALLVYVQALRSRSRQ